ncbi:MAG: ADP-glyceromanno-heptose 6-epimerase [Rhodospirillaceae bacterium]
MFVVTGASGFIGSNVLAVLEQKGKSALAAVDFRESEAKTRNTQKRKGLTWVAPTEIEAFLFKHAPDIEALIHLGAETATTATDRDAVFAVNVDLSKFLWRWCIETDTSLIYASSASVYGDGQQGFEDRQQLVEMRRLRPLNIYGESKLAFDCFVTEQVEAGGPTPPQWAGLRFFNVFGPNEMHKGPQASVVSQMYPVIAEGSPYPLFRSHRTDVADGEQKRDFIFVDDCIAVIQWLLENTTVSGVFNVGTGRARTFLDLAHAVYASAGLESKITWRDTPDHLKAHYQYFTEADMSRLRKAGFARPFTSLEDGVTITIRDYLSQADPYR